MSSTVSWNSGSPDYPVQYTATTANQYYHIEVYLEKWDTNHETKIEETPIGSSSACIFASELAGLRPYTFADTEREFTAGALTGSGETNVLLIQGNGEPAAASFVVTLVNTETQRASSTSVFPDPNDGNFRVTVTSEQEGMYIVYAVSSTGVAVDGSGTTAIIVAPASFPAARRVAK